MAMTRKQLLDLPATANLKTAFRAVGVGETKGREMVRNGTFPVRLLKVGKRYKVVTADLLALLGVATDESAA